MKKLLKTILCFAVALTAVVGIGGCFVPTDENAVQLYNISAADVGVAGYDYYVVAEPAASLKSNAIEGLNFVGDLQELYGDGNGYTQAVLVAKKSVIQENPLAISEFLKKVKDNQTWLKSDDTQISDVISAVNRHLASSDMTPSLNQKNLTRQVIENCGIKFSYTKDCKQALKEFISKVQAVDESAVNAVSDNFFNVDFSDDYTPVCDAVSKQYKVFMPDGAPALSLAQLMKNDTDVYNGATFNYTVVAADTIGARVRGGDADVCVLPSNAASKLLGDGETYQMLGTVTNGNLFLLSKNQTKINSVNVNSLRGKTVGVVNLANVPGLVFKAVLNDNNVKYMDMAQEV